MVNTQPGIGQCGWLWANRLMTLKSTIGPTAISAISQAPGSRRPVRSARHSAITKGTNNSGNR